MGLGFTGCERGVGRKVDGLNGGRTCSNEAISLSQATKDEELERPVDGAPVGDDSMRLGAHVGRLPRQSGK